MNVEETKIYIKNRNPREIELQEEKSRKAKKNRNKNNQTIVKKPIQDDRQLTKQEEKIISYVSSMFQNHKNETIVNVMRRVGADIQAITNQMLEIPEDKETFKYSNGKKEHISSKVEMECFQLMNNLTEEIQIDEYEFQQLFEEVSEMIKNNAQINKVLGNEMISQCEDSKHEFTKIREAYLDQLKIDDVDDQYLKTKYFTLLIEIQKFLLDQAKIAPQYKEKNVYKTYTEDFPTLASQPGQSVANKIHWETVQDKIEKQKNFGKTSYFDQANKKLPVWDESNSLHQLNGGNYIEKKDIEALSREYEMMNLTDLKIIYSHIGDLVTCRKFLKQYHSQGKSFERHIDKNIQKALNNNQPLRKKSIEGISRRQLDQNQINGELQKMNLREIRDFITHEMKLRAIFMQASSKIKNSNSKKKLVGLANENNNILMEYLIASRVKHLEEVFTLDGNVLDLHGYFAVEAEELVREYIKAVVQQYKKANPKVATKTKQGRLFAEVNIITGKGNNSANQKSVLKPLIRKVLGQCNVDYEDHQGGFTVKVFLN